MRIHDAPNPVHHTSMLYNFVSKHKCVRVEWVWVYALSTSIILRAGRARCNIFILVAMCALSLMLAAYQQELVSINIKCLCVRVHSEHFLGPCMWFASVCLSCSLMHSTKRPPRQHRHISLSVWGSKHTHTHNMLMIIWWGIKLCQQESCQTVMS